MEKKSTIKSIEFSNEFTNANGTTYYHKIELENLDSGSVGAKQKLPDKLKVGNEITYTIQSTERGNVIKLVQQNQGFGGNKGNNYKAEPIEYKFAGFALSYAKDLIVAGKAELSDFEALSDRGYNWLMSKKIVENTPSVAVKEEPTQNTYHPDAPETPFPEKWLNVIDKENNYTMEWLNVQADIKLGKLKSTAEVRKLYKVSKVTQDKLEEIFRFENVK